MAKESEIVKCKAKTLVEDDKSKYRKRPVFKPSLCDNEQSLAILKHIKNLRSIPGKEDDAILRCLEEHGNRGVNLYEIDKALDSINQRWYEKANTFNLLYNSEKYMKGFSKEKAIKNAFKLLLSLEPASEAFSEGQSLNKEITAMKAELKKYESLLKRYLDFKFYEANFEPLVEENIGTTPINYNDKQGLDSKLNILKRLFPKEKVKRIKPAKQKTHDIWDVATYKIVNEFKRVYQTDKTAYTETANLLKLIFEGIYKDSDPDLVKQRYRTYLKKIHKNS